jgi:hypothetical protein
MLTASQPATEKPIQRLPIPRKEFFERFTRPALEFQHQAFVTGHGHRQPKEAIYIICNAASGEKVPEVNRKITRSVRLRDHHRRSTTPVPPAEHFYDVVVGDGVTRS